MTVITMGDGIGSLRESDRKMLEAFSCSILDRELSWTEMPDIREWREIYRNAEEHKIFPMVMERISRSPFFQGNDEKRGRYGYYLKRSEAEIQIQAQRTADFLLLYDHLLMRGLKPLLMKGIICRSLYPEPEHRPSVDEDLLIDPREFRTYHQAMLDYGMELADPAEDIEKAYEVTYVCEETHLYIELHKHPFDPDSEVFGKWNGYFDCKEKGFSKVRIYGSDLYTLDATSHLIFLILHAFKHFLFSGFGIRLIADIIFFSMEYVDRINWEKIDQVICQVHAKDFVRAVYKIALCYLWKSDPGKKFFPEWDIMQIDEIPLLLDIMDSGVQGASTFTRLHSSNMTLHAMEQQDVGAVSSARALLHAIFLPGKSLEKRYPYLKKASFLLPIAWMQRILSYLARTGKGKSQDESSQVMLATIRLGKERIELLKHYNIIDRN